MLNCSIPHLYGFVRAEYLYNLESGFNEYVPCIIYGIRSVGGQALMFHVLLEDGASYWNLPISALCHKEKAPLRALSELQRWDCFGVEFEVTVFDYLKGARAKVFLANSVGELAAESGIYVFTVDWTNNGFSDEPSQHKCAHIIALDDGNFAAQPNNRLQFIDASFVKPFVLMPHYKTNTHRFSAEQTHLRNVSIDGRFFYREENK